MKKKKVKVFVLLEGLNFGGQQLMVYNLFNELKNNNEIDQNAGYLFSGNEDLSEKYNSVFNKVYNFHLHSKENKIKSNPFRTIYRIFKIIIKLKKDKFDVILTNGIYTFFIGSLVSFFIPGIKHFRLIGGDLHRNEGFFHYNKILRFFLPLYSYTDGMFTWNKNRDFYKKLNISYDLVIQEYNPLAAVNYNLFRKSSDISAKKLKEKLGIPFDYTVISWVGRIDADKEILESLELCSFLKSNYPEFKFKFLVIGDGTLRNIFNNKVSDYNLDDNYIRIDPVPQEVLFTYYSIIDFEVLLDIDPQGGSHIREAMSCERAVISVDGNSGVQRDLIQNNKTGFLVSPDNRISEAAEIIIKNYSDKEFLKEIGSNARVFIKQHSFANLSKIILEKIL